jgi:AmmeMemoRadiSam system protein B
VISDLRPSPIAGTWYPSHPERLAHQMDAYLAEAQLPALDGAVVAVISPHAGPIYSGRTAGYAFRCVQGQSFARVAVLSPMHAYTPAQWLTSAHKGYETPLGPVWIDQEAVAALDQAIQTRGLSKLSYVARDGEHALEIELPFLQRALAGEFQLLPLMVRTHEPEELRQFGEALAETLRQFPALMVASTDLSHFYPRELADRLDGHMLELIEAFSPERVLHAEEEGTGLACGVGAVAAVLWAAKALGANAVQVLHHSTSADQTGDTSSVVGYGAVVILKRG